MDPDGSSQLILFAVLLIMSALFTAAETALLSLSKHKLRHIVEELDAQAIPGNKLLNEPQKFYDTVLVGDSLVNIAAVVIGTSLAFNYWGGERGLIYAVILLSSLILLFGELLPRLIAAKSSVRFSLFLVRFLFVVMIILYPLVQFFNLLTVLLAKLVGVKPASENGVTEEAIIDLVTAGQEDGVFHQEEKTMIHSVFDFTDTLVKDVMVPRPDIAAVEKNASYQELLDIIKAEMFSRIPVYDNSIDNILGVVHIKDLMMAQPNGQEEFSLCNYLRQTIFVPETKKVNDLFRAMKKEKIHLAVVLDEYGSTAGLVTLEDLIEEIMGDIQDEHDTEEPEFHKIDANTFEVNASMRIDELNELFGLELYCEEADTLGGLVFTEMGRIPVKGEALRVKDIEMTVLDMEGHRIEKLRLTKQQELELSS